MRIALVNGINTHGEGNVDLLIRPLTDMGHDVRDIQLPKRHFISAAWGASKDAIQVIDETSDGDILVCHSFGALRSWYAHRTRNYRAIICVSPAASKDLLWSEPGRVVCFHSKQDVVILLGAAIPCHPFGLAGRDGFSQPGVNNIEIKGGHNPFKHLPYLCEIIEFAAGILVPNCYDSYQ